MSCSWASGSPLPTHLARPFRIMWTASIPCNVRHAVGKDWYPLASQTRFFGTRWSCSTTLFKYLHWRSRQRRRSVPSTLQTTFECRLGHVRKGDRKPQVPPHALGNDLARIVTPFEGIRRGDGHVSPYQIL